MCAQRACYGFEVSGIKCDGHEVACRLMNGSAGGVTSAIHIAAAPFGLPMTK